MSLREALNGHRNSFGILRLVLASAVIFDHAFPLGGWGTAPFKAFWRDQQSLGGLAVLGFFAISGYLVGKSAQNADVVQFLWRRFLRIMPGFWAALLVGAFVVGPIYWVLEGNDLAAYLTLGPDGPVAYLYRNWLLTIGQYQIHDIWVATTPFGLAGSGGPINGSIWTLVYEFTCYLLLAGLLAFGIVRKAKVVIPVVAALLLALQIVNQVIPDGAGSVVPFFGDHWRVEFGFIFFVGAAFAVYSDRVPYSNAFGVLSGLVAAGTLVVGGFNTIGFVAFAYFLLYLAARLPVAAQRVGAVNDYSYGIYLYGWIAEQVLAYAGVHTWGYLPYALLSLLLAAVVGVLSWHLVEKQALKLKDRGPGRGIAGPVARVRARFAREAPAPAPAPAPAEAT